MKPDEAEAFIRRQVSDYLLAGVTSMTVRQRERIARLEVVWPEIKKLAQLWLDASRRLGPPPATSTGYMRVVDMATGEIRTERTPAPVHNESRNT